MASVSPDRRTGRVGLNRVTALFERHHHIVQPIDGSNDFGVDLYVTFVSDFKTTGDTIAVQVKAGRSYRSAGGYRVRVGEHRDDWSKPNIPVVCVVHDPEADTLHWANATAQLRNASRFGDELKSIRVPRESVLADDTLPEFVDELRLHLSSRTDLIHALADHVGASVESTDYVAHFINEFGDLLFFQQQLGVPWAVLRHSRGGGVTLFVENPDSLAITDYGEAAWVEGGRMVDDFLEHHDTPGRVVLTVDERMWMRLCATASAWWRKAPARKG
ncbi:DUF4365 domain-containing protein [Actinosynnema sp. NPDC002837]